MTPNASPPPLASSPPGLRAALSSLDVAIQRQINGPVPFFARIARRAYTM
jgi:hypothetical protein